MRKSVSMGLVAGMLGLASAEVKVSDALSLNGFFDMSVVGGMPDAGPKTLTASLDQFEVDFMFKISDQLSARADVNSLAGGPVDLEQAYLTYALGSASLMGGKFASASGFEAVEPTGLYQYSTSKLYATYGGYQNGMAVSYVVSPMVSVYGSVVGSAWNGTDTDIKKPGVEAQVALTPVEGVTIKAAYVFEKEYQGTWDSLGTAVAYVTDRSLINVWGQYAMGKLTAAAEVNYLMKWDETEQSGLGYLVMANYKLGDKLGITGRYSALKMENGTNDNEVTVSPGYAVNGSLFVLAEVKHEIEAKNTTIAAESILSF